MIRGIGDALFSTYSQTLNGQVLSVSSVNRWLQCRILSGPFLVSRTGDEG